MPDLLDTKSPRLTDEHFEFVRFFKGLLVYVCLWPAIVSLTVGVLWWLCLEPPSTQLRVHDGSDAMLLGYVVGFLPAVIVGAMVSAFQIKCPSFKTLHVLLIGSVAGVLFAPMSFDKGAQIEPPGAIIRFTAVLVATLLCWLLIRRLPVTFKEAGA